MKYGFTGTQTGMTAEQKTAVKELLGTCTEFHHGDCVGADAEAHSIAYYDLWIAVVIHPPIINTKRAFCEGAILVHPPKDYLSRNKDIVDSTDFLIATPQGPETLRSGTWSTVRYARKNNKPGVIVLPDGTTVQLKSL